MYTVDFRKENFRTSRKKRHETMTGDVNGNVAQDGWEVKLNVNVQCILLIMNRELKLKKSKWIKCWRETLQAIYIEDGKKINTKSGMGL